MFQIEEELNIDSIIADYVNDIIDIDTMMQNIDTEIKSKNKIEYDPVYGKNDSDNKLFYRHIVSACIQLLSQEEFLGEEYDEKFINVFKIVNNLLSTHIIDNEIAFGLSRLFDKPINELSINIDINIGYFNKLVYDDATINKLIELFDRLIRLKIIEFDRNISHIISGIPKQFEKDIVTMLLKKYNYITIHYVLCMLEMFEIDMFNSFVESGQSIDDLNKYINMIDSEKLDAPDYMTQNIFKHGLSGSSLYYLSFDKNISIEIIVDFIKNLAHKGVDFSPIVRKLLSQYLTHFDRLIEIFIEHNIDLAGLTKRVNNGFNYDAIVRGISHITTDSEEIITAMINLNL